MRFVALCAPGALPAGAAPQLAHETRPVCDRAGADVLPRMVGQKLGGGVGPADRGGPAAGAGGIIAGEIVAKAPPDGYTWLVTPSANRTWSACIRGRLTTWCAISPRQPDRHDPVSDGGPSVRAGDVGGRVHQARPRAAGTAQLCLGRNGHDVASPGGDVQEHGEGQIVHVPYKGVAPGVSTRWAARCK